MSYPLEQFLLRIAEGSGYVCALSPSPVSQVGLGCDSGSQLVNPRDYHPCRNTCSHLAFSCFCLSSHFLSCTTLGFDAPSIETLKSSTAEIFSWRNGRPKQHEMGAPLCKWAGWHIAHRALKHFRTHLPLYQGKPRVCRRPFQSCYLKHLKRTNGFSCISFLCARHLRWSGRMLRPPPACRALSVCFNSWEHLSTFFHVLGISWFSVSSAMFLLRGTDSWEKGIYSFTFALTCEGESTAALSRAVRLHEMAWFRSACWTRRRWAACATLSHWREPAFCCLSWGILMVQRRRTFVATPYVCHQKLSDLCMIAYLATLTTWKGYSRSFRIVNISY